MKNIDPDNLGFIDPDNLGFLDKMGVLLGLTRTRVRSKCGSRVYDLKPFYRGVLIHRSRSNQLKTSSRINDNKWVDGWSGF
ncbi:hypothetical protein E5S67_06430 [Microcoleus sp. IPMA8]|uniref:Uncharacterized protein n=1 Tax=Microcoleus asticus IPMA8 TaxID=2563858 RepID=A0ABX2DAM2_9CYAN|nr:hypothetical protein [Microcoleus asticus IPMA8]